MQTACRLHLFKAMSPFCPPNIILLERIVRLRELWRAEEDRRERRRKLGLPEDLTPEEKAAEAAKLAEAAKAKAARALPVKPVSLTSQLRDVLVGLLCSNSGGSQLMCPPLQGAADPCVIASRLET